MGQNQSLNPGGGGAGDGQEKKKEEKKKYEPPPPPRTGRKKVKKGPDSNARLPLVTPNSKCRLRLLKLERVKDYLLMEEEFIQNQERLKPQEEKSQVSFSILDQDIVTVFLIKPAVQTGREGQSRRTSRHPHGCGNFGGDD